MDNFDKLDIIVKYHNGCVIFNYNGYEKSLYYHDTWMCYCDNLKRHAIHDFIYNVNLYIELEKYTKNFIYDKNLHHFNIVTINNFTYAISIFNYMYCLYNRSISNHLLISSSLKVIAEYSDENINMADYFDFNSDIKIALKD